jgi:uncharacterized membrane protein
MMPAVADRTGWNNSPSDSSAPPEWTPTEVTMERIPAIDRLRGLIMALMAIDHASFFVAGKHPGEFWGVPLPTYAGAIPFLTRWVTHLAAPGFFFLLGVGVVLLTAAREKAGWDEGRIFRHLAIRGLVLILAQHLIENLAWMLGQHTKAAAEVALVPGTDSNIWLHFGVLNALGFALIAAGVLTRLRPWMSALIGAGLIALTLYLVPSPEQVAEPFSWLQRLLFVPGRTGMVQVYYPILPWIGVAALGVAFGHELRKEGSRAVVLALPFGLMGIGIFLLSRFTGFGAVHDIESSGWIGLLNVTKYPPDLPFLGLTLGINLLLLAALAVLPSGRLAAWLQVFGGTALFFYLLHLYVYLALGAGFRNGTGYGMLYAGWGVGLVILYFACKRYGEFKRTTPVDSLWRFL